MMNLLIKLSAFSLLLCIIPGTFVNGSGSQSGFNKAALYSIFANGNLNQINTVLAELAQNTSPDKEAFEGALMMKKAGLLSKPNDKLKTFKSGRQKLENAIQKDADNVEYRFLRLVIQENAPKIVKYKSDIQNDGKLILASFQKLLPVVQNAVKNYSKKSKVLNGADL